MKIVCLCDLALNPKVMEPMKLFEKMGHKVEFVEDKFMQTAKEITQVMLQTEKFGADSSPANPDVVDACRDADIIVVHAAPINKDVLDAAKNVKHVYVLRSGIENVNADICKERGIKITNAPGRSAYAVADTAVALMLAEMKNIARGHKYLMDGEWKKIFVNFDYTHDLRKCTIGIIGAGQIGQKVISRLKGFESHVIVYDPFMTPEQVTNMGYEAVSLDELLRTSDIVSLHLRLSEKTEKFLGKEEFAKMKKTASLINTARAGLIDEEALIDVLKNKKIGGAALDVFNKEPLGKDSEFLKLDNVTLTPHLAGTSVDTFGNSVEIIFDEMKKDLQ